MIRRPPISPLFPYTPLSRSLVRLADRRLLCLRPPFQGTGLPRSRPPIRANPRSEEHTSELQSRLHLVCRLLLEKKKKIKSQHILHYSIYLVPQPYPPHFDTS